MFKPPSKNIISGSLLIFITLISLYLSTIPGLVLSSRNNLIQSIKLYDYGRKTTQTNQFQISDTACFTTNTKWANTYTITIFNKTGKTHTQKGKITNQTTNIIIPLYPPNFKPQNIYIYRLNVYALNFPIPGATLSDVEIGQLSIENTETQLTIDADFKQNSNQLHATTTLVNQEQEPIANQTVTFHLQPNSNDTSLPNRGWINLGSTKTDNQGKATLNTIIKIAGGQHRLQARFNNENFKDTSADTSVTLNPATPNIQFTTERSQTEAKITAKLTNPNGLPISQRLVQFTLPSLEVSQTAFTDIDGQVKIKLHNLTDSVKQTKLEFTVFKDKFTSAAHQTVNIDLTEQQNDPLLKTETDQSVVMEQGPRIEVGEVQLFSFTTEWISLVENRLSACYVTDESLGNLTFSFYFEDPVELLGSSEVEPRQIESDYVYSSTLVWTPDQLYYLGQNKCISVYLKDANSTPIAEGQHYVNIIICPNQLRILFPSNFAGENMSLVLAAAFPRVYTPPSPSSYVHTYRLAEEFAHDNRSYIIDDLVLSSAIFVEIYEDTELWANISLGSSGLETVSIPVNYLPSYENVTWWDITATVNSELVVQAEAGEKLTLTNNTIECSMNSSADFSFTDELLGLDEYNRTSINIDPAIEAYAHMFGDPLLNLSVTNIVGELQNKGTSSSAFTSSEPQLLRLSQFFNSSSTVPSFIDVVKSGKIDTFDVVAVASRYLLVIEDSSDWGVDCYFDVDGSGKIDIFDIISISANYGKKVYYEPEDSDPREVQAKFYYANSTLHSESALDIQGCVIFPADAETMELSWQGKTIEAKYENFTIVSESNGYTDFFGNSNSSFSPENKGVHILQTKAPSSFGAAHVRFGFYLFDRGVALGDPLNLLQYFLVIRSTTQIYLDYSPANATAASVTALATLIDEFSVEPVSNAQISFALYKTEGGNETQDHSEVDYTNSSGIAVYPFTPDCFLYRLKASFSQNYTHWGSTTSVPIDARVCSTMEVTENETSIGSYTFVDLSAGVNYEFDIDVSPPVGLSRMGRVLVYVDGEFHANISYNGSFDWSTTSEGAYYFNASYEGGDWTRPCLWFFCVNISVLPLLVYFDVSPAKFEPGDTVSLCALAKVADTNETFTGKYRFLEDSSKLIDEEVNASGEACVDWEYPDEGVHTVTVVITFQDGSPVPFMVQPLNLEVRRETKLLFWVERLDTSRHIFNGRLLTKSGSAMSDRTVHAYLNGSLLDEDLTTNGTGFFSFIRNFDPGEGKVFYSLEVVYGGSDNKTATLNGTDFMGNSYVVCQTTQFDYKPSSNMTSITIEPQASDVVVPTKTPEELQAEAEVDPESNESGVLRIKHKFSPFPPFYRIHFIFYREGKAEYDIGYSIIPFLSTLLCENAFIQRIQDVLPSVSWSIVTAIGIADFCSLIVANCGPWGFLGALALSTTLKLATLYKNWNSIDGLMSAYIGSLISTVFSLMKVSIIDMIATVLELIMNVKSLAEVGFGKLYGLISIPTNIAYQCIIMTRLDELGAFNT